MGRISPSLGYGPANGENFFSFQKFQFPCLKVNMKKKSFSVFIGKLWAFYKSFCWSRCHFWHKSGKRRLGAAVVVALGSPQIFSENFCKIFTTFYSCCCKPIIIKLPPPPVKVIKLEALFIWNSHNCPIIRWGGFNYESDMLIRWGALNI